MDTPKRRPLNNKQLDILRLLYRFRFATTDLLTLSLQTRSKIKMNERLKVLLDQEYIGRNFKPEYHFLRKHASYYLLPKGIDALKQIPDNKFDRSILRNIRKDKTASDQFIGYCLGVFSIYCQLKAAYGDSLSFFTKSQLANKYEYFSAFLPSVYMRLKVDEIEKDFFLEYLQSSKPFFTVIQRLKQYIEYDGSGEWETETESDIPKVLFVCDQPSLQKRITKRTSNVLEDADDDLRFYVTTQAELANIDTTVWLNLTEPTGAVSLDSI
jgi:DNA-binding MarR family transcriptional regulator